MLWTLLVAINSGSFISGALLWMTEHGKSTFGAYAFASIIGLILGASNARLWYKVTDALTERIQKYSASTQERYLRMLYVAAVRWMPVAAVIGYCVTWTAMRLL